MAGVHRLYIDSRFGVGAPNDFVVELPETVATQPDAVCFVNDVSIPVSWNNVDASNNLLYVMEHNGGPPYLGCTGRVVQIATGTYTGSNLPGALETAFNAPDKAAPGNYTVTFQDNKLLIALNDNNWVFRIFVREQVTGPSFLTFWNVSTVAPRPSIVTQNPPLANEVLGLIVYDDILTLYSSIQSDVVDVRNVHSVFICSEALSTYDSWAPWGGRAVIKRIPVNDPYGSVISNVPTGLGQDHVKVGAQLLKTLDFQLRDSYGNLVALQGHVSFTLLFSNT